MTNPSPNPSPQGGGEAALSDGAVDWEEVRRAYELTEESVASIRERYGLTAYELTKQRVAEGWTARAPIAKPGPLQGYRLVGSESLGLRLNRILMVAIALLEKRVAEEGMTEVNARTLTELCRAEELRMRSAKHKTAKTRETKNIDAGYDFRDDPAWLKAELERRLAILREDKEDPDAARVEGREGEAGIPGGLAD